MIELPDSVLSVIQKEARAKARKANVSGHSVDWEDLNQEGLLAALEAMQRHPRKAPGYYVTAARNGIADYLARSQDVMEVPPSTFRAMVTERETGWSTDDVALRDAIGHRAELPPDEPRPGDDERPGRRQQSGQGHEPWLDVEPAQWTDIDVLARMDADPRDLLEARSDGESVPEMAKRLGCSERTVQRRLRAAERAYEVESGRLLREVERWESVAVELEDADLLDDDTPGLDRYRLQAWTVEQGVTPGVIPGVREMAT